MMVTDKEKRRKIIFFVLSCETVGADKFKKKYIIKIL